MRYEQIIAKQIKLPLLKEELEAAYPILVDDRVIFRYDESDGTLIAIIPDDIPIGIPELTTIVVAHDHTGLTVYEQFLAELLIDRDWSSIPDRYKWTPTYAISIYNTEVDALIAALPETGINADDIKPILLAMALWQKVLIRMTYVFRDILRKFIKIINGGLPS